MCHYYTTPPSIHGKKCSMNWWHHGKLSVASQGSGGKTIETEEVLFDGFKGETATIQLYYAGPSFGMVTIYCLCYVLWQWTHTICSSVHLFILHTVLVGACVCVFLCGWVSLCTSDSVSVVTVENTNLASTSNAVCHVGAALLGAPLTLWTSQHFSLFTVAHAKPPLHLKSLHHVVNSLPKGNLHFSLPGYTACQKHKRRKLLCFRRYCVWFCYSVVCVFCRKLTDF